MTEWLEADCPVDYLNVWFPADWAPLVFKELQDRETKHRSTHSLWFDVPPLPTDSKKIIHERTNARRSREMHFQLGAMDRAGNLPTFIGKLKVDWIDFPLDDILQQFTTLKKEYYEGCLSKRQQALGLDVVPKKPKSLCCFREVMTSARGWITWMGCPIVCLGAAAGEFPSLTVGDGGSEIFQCQEAAVCTCSAEWANVTVESSNGTTLWTRDSVCVPVPQDDEYPLRLLVHPKARDQSHHLKCCMWKLQAWEAGIWATQRSGTFLCGVTQKGSMSMATHSDASQCRKQISSFISSFP